MRQCTDHPQECIMSKITSEERGHRLLNQNRSREMGSTGKAVSHFQYVSHTDNDCTVTLNNHNVCLSFKRSCTAAQVSNYRNDWC